MIQDIQRLMDDYYVWLKDKTALRALDNWVEITTPYLDRHNDCVQIYVRPADDGLVLTDDRYTLEDLEQSGCKLDSPKRAALLTMTLKGFGVQLEDKALQVHATPENFALRKHNLIQAMLAVNDLFFLAEPTILSVFREDVEAWLDLQEIRFTPQVKFTGKSGYDHVFDFVIPKSRRRPERIVKVINNPSRDTAQALAFSWMDTREVRPPNSVAYAMLNDADRQVSQAAVEALRSYDVHPVPWSERERVREALAA